MKINKIIMSLLILLISHSVIASVDWEPDNFTNRSTILKASDEEVAANLKALNAEVNKGLRTIIFDLNKNPQCEADLIKAKQGEAPVLFDKIVELFAGKDSNISRFAEQGTVKLYNESESIAQKKPNFYGKKWGFVGSFNFNGHIVGVDKLDAFFYVPYELITIMIEEGIDRYGFNSAMAESNDSEEMDGGLFVSGIKSYADMSASFSGLAFYYNLVFGDDRQIQCNTSSQKYTLEYEFDWRNYVDDSWDEGINCSLFEDAENPYKGKSLPYRRPAMHWSLEKYLHKIGQENTCPIAFDKCAKIAKKTCANYIVSPQCLSKVRSYAKCDGKNLNETFQIIRATHNGDMFDKIIAEQNEHKKTSK
jgi:hypothetical protein